MLESAFFNNTWDRYCLKIAASLLAKQALITRWKKFFDVNNFVHPLVVFLCGNFLIQGVDFDFYPLIFDFCDASNNVNLNWYNKMCIYTNKPL